MNGCKKMAYNSKNSDKYHIFKSCTVGNNIEKENLQDGSAGKTLCEICNKMQKRKIKNKKEKEKEIIKVKVKSSQAKRQKSA